MTVSDNVSGWLTLDRAVVSGIIIGVLKKVELKMNSNLDPIVDCETWPTYTTLPLL